MDTLFQKLNLIQTKLVAPKGQFNAFGKYNYRSCEDILEALKPLLKETSTTVIILDDIVMVGDRHYVKATAKISDGTSEIYACAFAREPKEKKGMDEAQITGATSSYARKYALNALFCIDDSKDADASAPATSSYITEQQLHTLRDSLIAIDGKEDKFLAFLKVEKLELLPAADYQKAINAINASKAKKAV